MHFSSPCRAYIAQPQQKLSATDKMLNSLLCKSVSGINCNLALLLQNQKTEIKTMAKKCPITGKGPMVGNNVSHANNKTKRRYLPNLQHKRFWLDSEKRFVRLRITTRGMRIIDKLGIEAVLADIKLRKQIENAA
jgi:large subunit ribosomal protein L28